MLLHMEIHKIPCEKGLVTIFALVTEGPWKMHALNMFPQVATVASNLATYGAFVAARTILKIFHYV